MLADTVGIGKGNLYSSALSLRYTARIAYDIIRYNICCQFLFTHRTLHIYIVLAYALVLSWCVFSFLFWRALRSDGIDEDKIFDLTFYSTIVAFVFSRIFFVALNWDLFADTGLRIFAIWVQPGLSLYGAFYRWTSVTLVFLSRRDESSFRPSA